MKIWITGIAGFLGSHLAWGLIKLGHQIYGNDSMICGDKHITISERGMSTQLNENSELLEHGWMVADCRQDSLMREKMEWFKPDVVVHCAATAHEGLSNFSPAFITGNIYAASVSTFSAAIAAGVKRIIFMSSMARYGEGFSPDTTSILDIREWYGTPFEENYRCNPLDPYGIAKVAAEHTLRSLCRLHDVEYVIAVPHNIIGPRQKYDDPYRNVASIMINRALQGKPILVYGDGQQKRCFSPIDDCLSSLVKMIDAPISGEIINIGPDKGEITVLELAEMIRDLTGGVAEIQHMPDRPNEVKNAYCSSDKARKLLGYEPKQNIRECLAEMVLYIKEHGTKEFQYTFPIEIEKGAPKVWVDKML